MTSHHALSFLLGLLTVAILLTVAGGVLAIGRVNIAALLRAAVATAALTVVAVVAAGALGATSAHL